MIFLADLSASQVLVADVAQRLAQRCPALFIGLMHAGFSVVVLTDVQQELLLPIRFSVISVLLVFLRLLSGDASFTFPVSPHVGQLIR